MGNIFGQKKKAPKKDPAAQLSANDKAVWELKKQRDRLKKYREKLELVRQREIEVAKACLAKGQKKRALLALKKKKTQEKMLQKAEGQMLNLEEMISSVEFAAMQKQIFEALESGKNTLEELNNEISLEEVEALMEESEEAIARRNEISEAMGSSLTSEDEAAIDEELASLLDDEQKDGVTVAAIKALPEATRPLNSTDMEEIVPQANSTKASKTPTVLVTS